MISRTLFVSTVALLRPAHAWGTLGHTTVAYIAQNLVSNKTAHFAQLLLNDTSSAYLANIATWADSYRYTDEGAFSSPLHYIDALDTPPESCNVDFKRDCPEEGCIVSAIANYTERVSAENVTTVEKQKALKWLVHFIGDTHQPLHVENLEVGGNLINITFEGKTANLHHIWDTEMPEKLVGEPTQANAKAWAASLTEETLSGKYANQSKSWLEGTDIKDPIESAMTWARDANAYVCSTVVPEGAEGVRGKEVSGAYYEAAVPVIQLQIAKAGFRLAAWLDLIVEGAAHGHGGYKSGQWAKWIKGHGKWEKREQWMEDARQQRRDFGWGCGCEDHAEIEHVH
jgi:hypothetical protein